MYARLPPLPPPPWQSNIFESVDVRTHFRSVLKATKVCYYRCPPRGNAVTSSQVSPPMDVIVGRSAATGSVIYRDVD